MIDSLYIIAFYYFYFTLLIYSDWLSEVLVGLKEQYRSLVKANSGQDSFVELSTDDDGLVEFFRKNQGKKTRQKSTRY